MQADLLCENFQNYLEAGEVHAKRRFREDHLLSVRAATTGPCLSVILCYLLERDNSCQSGTLCQLGSRAKVAAAFAAADSSWHSLA